MISSLIEWPHRSTCHHPSRHNRGEATGTWIPRQIEDIPSIISIQSASNSLIALTWLGAPVRVYPRTDTSSASSVSYVSCSSWSTPADCDRSPLFQPPRYIERVVCENHVDPGALEAGESFQDDPALVDPAAEGGGLDHGVLARDVVGRHRDAEGVLDAAGDVEVGQGRLDHDNVGALRQVEGDLADRLVAVGRVHLVAAAIAEAGGTFGRVA